VDGSIADWLVNVVHELQASLVMFDDDVWWCVCFSNFLMLTRRGRNKRRLPTLIQDCYDSCSSQTPTAKSWVSWALYFTCFQHKLSSLIDHMSELCTAFLKVCSWSQEVLTLFVSVTSSMSRFCTQTWRASTIHHANTQQLLDIITLTYMPFALNTYMALGSQTFCL